MNEALALCLIITISLKDKLTMQLSALPLAPLSIFQVLKSAAVRGRTLQCSAWHGDLQSAEFG